MAQLVDLEFLFCSFSRHQISRVHFPTSPKLSCKHSPFHLQGLIFSPSGQWKIKFLTSSGQGQQQQRRRKVQTQSPQGIHSDSAGMPGHLTIKEKQGSRGIHYGQTCLSTSHTQYPG